MKKKLIKIIAILLFFIAIAAEFMMHIKIDLSKYNAHKLLWTIIIVVICAMFAISCELFLKLKFTNEKSNNSNKAKKIFRVTLYITLIIFLIYHFIFGYIHILEFKANKQIEYNIGSEYNAGNKEVDLVNIIPFEWDYAYFITGYSDEEEIKIITGADFTQIKRTKCIDNSDSSEVYSYLFFFKDDRLVFVGGSWYLKAHPKEYEQDDPFCFKFYNYNSKFIILKFNGYKFELQFEE